MLLAFLIKSFQYASLFCPNAIIVHPLNVENLVQNKCYVVLLLEEFLCSFFSYFSSLFSKNGEKVVCEKTC
jgi:hypothetical protein